jgi:spoIIIJ-associated protein
VIDCERYRERRREALEEMARRMADEAKRRNRTIKMNAMSPRDRRIVHLVLQRDAAITTRSSGKGHFRKLIIIPRGGVRSDDSTAG